MNEGAGDWICSDPSCGNINFARRMSCYRCNKDRPDGGKTLNTKKLGTEIGKSAAEKSRGLFNADDWQCNKCANVNWARRTTCNVCNAPKFGEVEARTGYGGGYNERGVVEYRRREPSSDDEYDEFGRKKRKRKSDPQNAVGITEGPLAKKLPPALLQMDLDMDAKEVPAPNVSMQTKTDTEKAWCSQSESSMCELPPLSRMAFRRHQLENQTNYNRQEHMLPSYIKKGAYFHKRFPNHSNQDSDNKIASKILKHEIINSASTKCLDQNKPVKVQSMKNDFVYKFTGSNPTEDYEVRYSLEERVKVAAYAIVHNNCKISTDKFEAIYDKPAPDFKTIFAWRQRLLKTGCLDDSHIHPKYDLNMKVKCGTTNLNNNVDAPPKTQLNPEEIPLSSDSETEYTIINGNQNNIPAPEIERSTSVETLVIGNSQKASGSLGSPAAEQATQGRNHSSPRSGARSTSCDSQDSNYSDSDSEKADAENSTKQNNIPINTNGHQNKQSTVRADCESTVRADCESIVRADCESDSVTYDSDYVDFLSRVYGEGSKPRHRMKKRRTLLLTSKTSDDSSSNNAPAFQGYSTVKKSDQSPLATVNIYTSNMKNMQVRSNANLIDADVAAAEYVPTKLVSSTKKNYQDFKNNVQKKGYWAKGNCTTVQKNKQPSPRKSVNNHTQHKFENMMSVFQTNVATIPLIDTNEDSHTINVTNHLFECVPEQPQVAEPQGDDFTNDDFEQTVRADNYTSFDKPLQINDSAVVLDTSSRIFDVVQSNSIQKNKSIMEIFDVFDEHTNQESNGLDNNDAVKPYTVVWGEEDDALYKDEDDAGQSIAHNSQHNKFEAAMHNSEVIESKSLIRDGSGSPHLYSGTNIQEMSAVGELFTNNPKSVNSLFQRDDTRKVLSQVIQPAISKDEYVSTFEHNGTPEKIIPENKITKKINIIESITIKPKTSYQSQPQMNEKKHQTTNSILSHDSKSPLKNVSQQNANGLPTQSNIDMSNLLAGINTDTLLLALQSVQQLSQKPAGVEADTQWEQAGGAQSAAQSAAPPLETINLTNDEDWEKESDSEGSIERQLKRLHGNAGDTPFLSDIFDPGPVVIPPIIANKLNMCSQQNGDTLSDTQENTPVIGNFKSFALPKPIMLNRLKLTIKQPDKTTKQSTEGRKRRRNKKSKASALGGDGEGAEGEEAGAGEEGDEEESGDDADLSKYDLWGSDEEEAQSSKTETTEKPKDGEGAEAGSDAEEKNGKSDTVENKTAKRRRSSSTSSSSSSSSSSSRSSADAPKNKFDDFNLNSERESSPGHRAHSSHSHSRGSASGPRRKPRSRSGADSRGHGSGRDKQKSRSRERRERRGSRSRSRSGPARKERRYSRDGAPNHYAPRGRHR